MAKRREKSYLVWLDLDTTGLSVETAAILDATLAITDEAPNVIAEAPSLAPCQDDGVLGRTELWAAGKQVQSGLAKEVHRSTLSLERGEWTLLALVWAHCPPCACARGGNSVSHDRRFVMRPTPRLEGHLSYRSVDVSSVKELVLRWHPDRAFRERIPKHRALADPCESIEEQRHSRAAVFGTADG